MEDRRTIDAVMQHNPDKRGQEGRVRFFGTPEKPLVLKEWYRNHSNIEIELRYGLKIPISPYFHKAQFYEMKVIHDLFPDRTVGVMGATDPRMQGTSDEPNFQPTNSAPLVVMERAQGDNALIAEHDAILKEAYNIIHPIQDAGELGQRGAEVAAATRAADRQVIERFGQELEDPFVAAGAFGEPNIEISLQKALAHAVKVNPDSFMVELLSHGIAVAHPAFNYVPDKQRPDQAAPPGTYLELYILEPKLLAYRIQYHNRDNADLQRHFRRWQLMDELDKAYRRGMLGLNQRLINDPEVQQTFVCMLRSAERYGNASRSSINHIADIPAQMYEADNDRTSVLATLDGLRIEYDDQTVIEDYRRRLDEWYNSVPLLNDQATRAAEPDEAFQHIAAITYRAPNRAAATREHGQTILQRLEPLREFTGSAEELTQALNTIRDEFYH